MRPPLRVTHPRLFALCLAVLGGLLCALALELTARLLLPDDTWAPPPPALVQGNGSNPFVRWMRPWIYAHLPGARYTQQAGEARVDYAINKQGFRGPDIPDKGPLPRLLVMGDSFCEGHGVDANATFAAGLARRAAPRWEVVNVGVQGASPLYHAANLPRFLALAPDAVLLCLYDNDLWEDRVYAWLYRTFPRPLRPERLLSPRPALLERSRAQLALRRAARDLWPAPLERTIQAQADADAPPPDAATGARVLLADRPDWRWERSRVWLDHVADSLASRGVRLLVVQLSWEFHRPGLDPAFPAQAAWLETRYRDWTTARGLPFLPLREALARELAGEGHARLTIPGDTHPTPEGHRRLESLLAPFLEAHLP